jgi:hypothetical protein
VKTDEQLREEMMPHLLAIWRTHAGISDSEVDASERAGEALDALAETYGKERMLAIRDEVFAELLDDDPRMVSQIVIPFGRAPLNPERN